MDRLTHIFGRTIVALALTFAASLVAAGGAQAIVVDMNPSAVGQTSVTYPADQSSYYGVALLQPSNNFNFNALTDNPYAPWLKGLAGAGVPYVTTGGACTDPALTADLGGPALPNGALCSHGGSVIHSNETFAITWDPDRRYWQTTRNYVEQFLSDVAAGSGTLTSAYSITGQYSDSTGRAANSSVYGGGCIDYGSVGGYTCQLGSASGTGSGHSYTDFANGCTLPSSDWGSNVWASGPNGPIYTAPNDVCVTDSQIRSELAAMVSQAGVVGHTKPGYTPLIVLLTPPGVVDCIDAAGHLCSANGSPNSGATAQFCSYHSQVQVGSTEVSYVVQPWTAQWGQGNGCDEPDAPNLVLPVNVQTLAVDVGIRLVSPLSQGQSGALTDPSLDGWFTAAEGAEINDNGCIPLGSKLDSVTVGSSSQNPYLLQRESNNAGLITSDPNALPCIDWTTLTPTFVVPSAVNPGDVVALDGSTTASSLIIPKANYIWSFGDGSTGIGPSVEHTYTNGGTYTITLTVIDRGGNVSTLSQSIQVLGKNGQPVAPPGGSSGSGGSSSNSPLTVRLQLLPQSLRSMISHGILISVGANQSANGIVTVSITRSAAKRAHIKAGRGPSVVIGRGTLGAVKNGTVVLHLHLSKATLAKLKHLRRVKLTVRLALLAANGTHLAIDAAANY